MIWRHEMEQDLSFEEALLKLEEIVTNLETGSLTLDESLSKFESGITLSRLCNKKLKNAKQKVEKLIEKNNTVQTKPLSD
jgi:exodeoxyribonuclease VII small subunit